MSRDSLENTEDNSQVELSSKEHDIPNLSDYAKNLEKNVKSRYLCKKKLTGLHDSYSSWHLYICRFLFGLSIFL